MKPRAISDDLLTGTASLTGGKLLQETDADGNVRWQVRGKIIVAMIALIGSLASAGAGYLSLRVTGGTHGSAGTPVALETPQASQSSNDILRGSLTDVEASDVLKLDARTMNAGPLTGETWHVSGKLLQELPSGVQIWAGSNTRGSHPGAVPMTPFGVQEQGPCNVDLRANTFDCGDVYLGDGEKGAYAIYVGLATSDQARRLVQMVTAQVCHTELSEPKVKDAVVCRQDWTGQLPLGMRWLKPIVKIRS